MLAQPLSLLEARLLSASFALSRRGALLLRQRRSNRAHARQSCKFTISGCRSFTARTQLHTSPQTYGSGFYAVATGGATTTPTRSAFTKCPVVQQRHYGAAADREFLPATSNAPAQQARGQKASQTLAPRAPRGLLPQPSTAGEQCASAPTAAVVTARQVHGLSPAHVTTAEDPRDVVRRIILSGGGLGHADGNGSSSFSAASESLAVVTQQQQLQQPGGSRGAHAAASIEAVALVSSATGAPLQPPWCDNGGCSAHMAPQRNQDTDKAARRLEERLRHLPGPDLAPLALALLPRLPPPRVAQLAVALAKLGDFDAGCKAELAEHVVMHMDQFTPSELADVAWSLARCAFYDLTFNEALAGRLSSGRDVWDPPSLTRVLWAFGRFRFLPGHDPALLDSTLTAMVQHLVRQQQQKQKQKQVQQQVQEDFGQEQELGPQAWEQERGQQQEENRRGARVDEAEGPQRGAGGVGTDTVAAAATPAHTATCVSEVVFAAEQLHWRDSRLQREVADYARGNMQAFGPEALGKLAAGLAGCTAVDGPLVAALYDRAEQLAYSMGVLDINRILLLLTRYHEEVKLRSAEALERSTDAAAAAAASAHAAEGSSPSPENSTPSPSHRPLLGEAGARCLAAMARRAVELSEPATHSTSSSSSEPPATATAVGAAAATDLGPDPSSPSGVPPYDYPPFTVDGPIDAPQPPNTPPLTVWVRPRVPTLPTTSPQYCSPTAAALPAPAAAPGLNHNPPNASTITASPLSGFPGSPPSIMTSTPAFGTGHGTTSNNTETRGAVGTSNSSCTSNSSSSSSSCSGHVWGGSSALRGDVDAQLLSEAVSRFSALGCVGEHVMRLAARALAVSAQQPAGIL